MFDHEDLKTQARRSRRQLREHVTTLTGIREELAGLLQQADQLKSDAEKQLAELEECIERAEDPRAGAKVWHGLQLLSGVPLQMDSAVMELQKVIGAQDYLVRMECAACGRPFLVRRSRRQRQYCSGRCRVWAYRKRQRAE